MGLCVGSLSLPLPPLAFPFSLPLSLAPAYTPTLPLGSRDSFLVSLSRPCKANGKGYVLSLSLSRFSLRSSRLDGCKAASRVLLQLQLRLHVQCTSECVTRTPPPPSPLLLLFASFSLISASFALPFPLLLDKRRRSSERTALPTDRVTE